MQLPWRSIRKPVHTWPESWPPTATQWLVAANAAGFLTQWLLAGGFRVVGASGTPSSEAVDTCGALSLEGLRAGRLWQPLTCLFLHESVWTLLIGLITLYFAGRHLEMVVGRRHLFALYTCGGLLGSAGQLGWHSMEDGPPAITGASSAVMAVFIAFACTMPELEVTPLLATAGTVRPRGVRVKHLAIGTVFASAALLVINPGGRMRGQTDLTGWMVGCLVGAVYMRQLGFGGARTAGGLVVEGGVEFRHFVIGPGGGILADGGCHHRGSGWIDRAAFHGTRAAHDGAEVCRRENRPNFR